MVFYVSQVFLEAGVEGVSRFADVEFGAFGAMNNVHDVVRHTTSCTLFIAPNAPNATSAKRAHPQHPLLGTPG